jgi:hypothetical protein
MSPATAASSASSTGKDWATRFARYTALALGRDTVRIDVAAFNIGY